MTRSIAIIATIIAALGFSLEAYAGINDRIISFNELPTKARDFCTQHFGGLTVAYVEAEYKLFGTEYEVKYTDSTEIEFDTDGSWKKVDRKYSAVPSAIIPAKITNFVNSGKYVKEIKRSPHTWKIELSDGIEIKFDSKFNVIEYDD